MPQRWQAYIHGNHALLSCNSAFIIQTKKTSSICCFYDKQLIQFVVSMIKNWFICLFLWQNIVPRINTCKWWDQYHCVRAGASLSSACMRADYLLARHDDAIARYPSLRRAWAKRAMEGQVPWIPGRWLLRWLHWLRIQWIHCELHWQCHEPMRASKLL